MPAGRDAPRLVCGVDEAGRGPIAGPVFAAAVILAAACPALAQQPPSTGEVRVAVVDMLEHVPDETAFAAELRTFRASGWV